MTTSHVDEDLVRRTLAGETAAYEALVRSYRRAAIARALAIVGDPLDAEDIAQEAFVHAYDQLATLRDQTNFAAWLLTIVHRRALNAARGERRRRRAALSDAIAAVPSGESSGGDAALRRSILAALATLSEVQRTIVLLADLEDWPHQRIANAIGCSVAMSRRHLSDARQQLRQILAKEVHDVDTR